MAACLCGPGTRGSKLWAQQLQTNTGTGKVCSQLAPSSLVFASNGKSLFWETPDTEKKTPAAGSGQQVTPMSVRMQDQSLSRDHACNEEEKNQRRELKSSLAQASPAQGRQGPRGAKREEPWAASFSTLGTHQASPYPLAKSPKELCNPFPCSPEAAVNSLIRWVDMIHNCNCVT